MKKIRYTKTKSSKNKIAKNRTDIVEINPTMSAVYIKSFHIEKTWNKDQVFYSKVNYIQEGIPSCRNCACNDVVFYDYYKRKARFINKQGLIRVLFIRAKRYRCKYCDSVFRESIEGLLPYKQSSENYRKRVATAHFKGISNKQLSLDTGISQSTVERIIHEQFKLKANEQLNYECPKVLGIDEHTIHKGYKFATTICDLSNHRVYDVINGRKCEEIESTLMKYKGRENVEVVCIDLSSNYRNVIRRCFPRARIVADRFHVIRLVQYHFMEFCKAAQEEVKWNRGLMYPLRKHAKNLKSYQRERLESFFGKNPAIKICYEFKERLCELLNRKSQTMKECKRNIKELKEMMQQMKYEGVKEFETLAKTLSDWWEPIIRMWRFTKNNGITEGFHRKMKLIQRIAYGYRNFENYRLRVLVKCGINLFYHSLWC